MTRTVLVVPTGSRAGLTSTSLGLVVALERAGVAVGFAKPLAQPRRGDVDPSTLLVEKVSDLHPPAAVVPAQVEALLAAGRLDDLMGEVVAVTESLAAADVVVVEGLVPDSGGLWSTRLNVAMARALDADVLLVADGSGLSTGADSSNRAPRSDTADGPPSAADPHPHPHADAVRRLAESVAIAASPYRSGERSRVAGCVVSRVNDVVVCAQAVPGLLPMLRDGRLLLVPGDRHDVVMAACLAELGGVRLAGLLLTAGIEPHPEVRRLTTTATASGLPILLVDELTYPTAVRLHDLDPGLPTDDVERARDLAATVAGALDPHWLRTLPDPDRPRRLTPASFRRQLVDRARAAGARIVLPEGAEARVVAAAVACAERGIARCVLLASPVEAAAALRVLGRPLPAGVEVVDPAAVAGRHVQRLVALRAHRAMTPELAADWLTDPVIVATMMLAAGEVDGLVAGAVHTTAATVRPALQLIRLAPGARLVSSVFFMCLPDQVVVYGDCAINTDPDAADLAEIALQSADSAAAFAIEPRVAMISYSTGSSGAGVDVDKVTAATRLAGERRPGLVVDGPLQYDAAAVASTALSKRPGSPVAGRATVFVFPDLDTGNTTYKAVQRSADVVGIGPMLQGLAKPVNDLSRGATVEDIVYTIALTAVQAAATRSDAGRDGAPVAASADGQPVGPELVLHPSDQTG